MNAQGAKWFQPYSLHIVSLYFSFYSDLCNFYVPCAGNVAQQTGFLVACNGDLKRFINFTCCTFGPFSIVLVLLHEERFADTWSEIWKHVEFRVEERIIVVLGGAERVGEK